jgi:hypothetical protein
MPSATITWLRLFCFAGPEVLVKPHARAFLQKPLTAPTWEQIPKDAMNANRAFHLITDKV